MSLFKRCLKHPAVVAIALLAGLAGCAATRSTYVDRSLQVVNGEDAGTIVGTIGARSGRFSTDVSPFSFNTLFFRKVGSRTGGILEFAPPDALMRPYTPDFEDDKFKGNVFSQTLPPGEYELYSVSFYYNTGHTESTFTPKTEFSIPFTVEKGKVTYLGSIMAWGVWGKNFLRIPVPAGGYFVVEDRRLRDLPLIQARLPSAVAPQVKVLQPDARIPYVRGMTPG